MEKADKYLDALNELRLLMFVECTGEECQLEDAPQERHFHHVLPNPKQFKIISDTIFTPEPDEDVKEGFETGMMQISERCLSYKHFEGLDSHT